MFNLTYEFKLKPTKNQIGIFEEWLETHRRVYNYALAERKDWYKSRSCQIKACSLHSCYIISADAPRPTYASQCKSLTAARKNNEHLGKINAQSLQQTLRRRRNCFCKYVGTESRVSTIQKGWADAVFFFSSIRQESIAEWMYKIASNRSC